MAIGKGLAGALALAAFVASTARAQTTTSSPQPAPAAEGRALWVTRFDYTTDDDVRTIIRNTAALNFNVVLFQVRGNGTAFYRSEIEPWAWELSGTDASATGTDPGWDPLAIAVDEAHAHGLQIHAYMNVMPGWRAQDFPPPSAHQLWTEHPDWFMADAAGDRMVPRDHRFGPNPDWYAFVNPAMPQVRDHIASVFEEVARNYDVDGIHFDYIRYPGEIREVAEGFEDRVRRLGNWSYDPVSLSQFTADTGVTAPDDSPEAWTRWRAAQVTATLRQIRERVLAAKPGLILSAAVMPDPVAAHDDNCQAWSEWLRAGLIDLAVLMNYTRDNQQFLDRCQMAIEAAPRPVSILPGMGLDTNPETVAAQIEQCRSLPVNGFACFAYASLFDRDHGHTRTPLGDALAAGALVQPAASPWQRPER